MYTVLLERISVGPFLWWGFMNNEVRLAHKRFRGGDMMSKRGDRKEERNRTLGGFKFKSLLNDDVSFVRAV